MSSAQKKLRITRERLLLVEGRDEENLLGELVTHLGLSDIIQTVPVGGAQRFPMGIQAIAQASLTLAVRALAVVRDADQSAQAGFQSVCSALAGAGFVPPGSHGTFADATPKVGVFVVPDGSSNGAIETLCRQSVQASPITNCVDDYLDCLRSRNSLLSSNEDKTFAHAYLSACPDPVARVGEGARQGVWDFTSPAFGRLSAFVQELATI